MRARASGARLRSQRLSVLSGDWEGAAGDRRACLEKHPGAGNTAFLAVSQKPRRITHARFSEKEKKKKEGSEKQKERKQIMKGWM